MATVDPIKIEGLVQFQAKLRDAQDGLQKELRVVFNEAADVIVTAARPLVPRRSGALAASLRASSGQRDATVSLGRGKTTRYAGWIEFGGRVGRNRSVVRRFVPAGRSMYPALRRREAAIVEIMADGLNRLADKAGL